MSHPLFFLSKTFFYPIGNTAATCLTQDLSPEQSADILLLGCGDPRNILYTLYADVVATSEPRKMDVTCCDIEPAILARNILLFTLLEENEDINRIWNIFYHFKIDDRTSKLLIQQSQRLYDNAKDIETWRQSSYGSFLKFLDSRTLVELRRYWKNYADFPKLPANRLDKLRQELSQLSKSVLDKNDFALSPSRSAGILWIEASKPVNSLFRRYWETGTTFTLATDIKNAKNLNPTFIYSLPGERFDPHYGSFPQGFHLTSAFAPISSDPIGPLPSTGSAAVNVMKQQFKAWCDAFRASRAASAITIRFYTGDAIAFCRALDLYASTGQTLTSIFMSAWRAPQIHFDELAASTPSAPTEFDVIDTSNLTDHLGLLNLLLVTRPLLKKSPASQSVLYTETLLPSGEDATQSFLDRICASVPTISTILGVAPRPYVSSFTTHSNVHELLFAQHVSQYHERVAWVDPAGGDHHARFSNSNISFDAEDLAHIVFGIYDKMFANEQFTSSAFPRSSLAGLKSMNIVHYHRETVGALLQLVKRYVHLKTGDWDIVANSFLELVQRDRSRLVGMNNYQDLCLQLHLYGIHTTAPLEPDWHSHFVASPRSKIFHNWSDIPPTVCVVLTVPRKSLDVLLIDKEYTGTPPLQCNLMAGAHHANSYSVIHAIWGKCIVSPGSQKVALQEDPEGIHGNSGLVVSFWAPSWILEFEGTMVALAITSTPQSATQFMGKLGLELAIFEASINDQEYVHLLPYRPVLASQTQAINPDPVVRFPGPIITNSSTSTLAVINQERGQRYITSYTAHISIKISAEKETFSAGATVSAVQISPCTMKLSVGHYDHIVTFPYPIRGSPNKLRIARKSHYVEIVVQLSNPLDFYGYFLDPTPILHRDSYSPWNVHHIRIDRMPILELKDPKKVDWLNPHSALQLSDREKSIMNGSPDIKSDASNVFVNVKESIHALMMSCSGVQGEKTRTIGLCEPTQGGIYAILLVGGLRLDLASFTVVIDAALIPLSEDKMPLLMPGIQKLQNDTPVAQIVTAGHEAIAWKKLLPAYAERCRTWTHKTNCEYASHRRIPISTELDQNPLCSCGQGIGFTSAEWKVPSWRGLLPFATRAAISPIFSVSYIERVAGEAKSLLSSLQAPALGSSPRANRPNKCWLCGSTGKPTLLACSKCKQAKYCSAACQRQDWKEHKKECTTA